MLKQHDSIVHQLNDKMKSVLKKLFVFVFVLLIIGFFFCVYVMQAPPVAEQEQPKLLMHVQTSVRKRPTVNSVPVGTTKNEHLFSLDHTYLSNLNSSILSGELLFNVVLGVRAKYNAPLLDKEVSTGFDWQKMFAESAVGIRLKSKTPKIKVTLSGQDWFLTDSTGAGYLIQKTGQKTGDQLEIFLPDLLEAFELNNMILSNDYEFTVVKPGKQWLITDNVHQQRYEIRSDAKKINVYQYPKYPIQTLLFEVDSDPQIPLPEEKLPDEIYKGFESMDIPLSPKAKVLQEEDGVSWKITEGTQKYTIRHEDSRLKVYLDLDSGWLLLKLSNRINAWVQSERGTILMPPEPTLTSRQQLKKDMLAFFAKLKNSVGISDQNDL